MEREFRARGGFTMLAFAAVALLVAIGSFALVGAVERNLAAAVVCVVAGLVLVVTFVLTVCGFFVVSPNDGQPKDHLLMAAAVMMTIPVILIFFIGQRYFVRGVAMTGIKG